MTWKVYLVSPTGLKRLAGGVKQYRMEDTAKAAENYYKKMVRDGANWKGWHVERVAI